MLLFSDFNAGTAKREGLHQTEGVAEDDHEANYVQTTTLRSYYFLVCNNLTNNGDHGTISSGEASIVGLTKQENQAPIYLKAMLHLNNIRCEKLNIHNDFINLLLKALSLRFTSAVCVLFMSNRTSHLKFVNIWQQKVEWFDEVEVVFRSKHFQIFWFRKFIIDPKYFEKGELTAVQWRRRCGKDMCVTNLKRSNNGEGTPIW